MVRARHLIVPFALALAARACLFAAGPADDVGRAMRPDSGRYLALAETLREHGTFAKHDEDGLVHRALAEIRAANGTLPVADGLAQGPESFRTPGYPLLIAILLGIFGDVRAVLLVQCLIGAAVAPLLVFAASRFGLSPRAALAAGLVWALHPALLLHDNLVLSESLFSACAALGLAAAARAPGARGLACSGLLLGAATLVRPVGLLFLPAAAAVGLRPGRRTLGVLCLTVAAAGPPGAWAARNLAAGEGFRVSSVGQVNLLFYTAAYAISEERGEDWLTTWPVRVRELRDRLALEVHPGEDVVAAAGRLALREIESRPRAFARVHIKSFLKLWVGHSLQDASQLLGRPYIPSGLFSSLVLRERTTARPPGALLQVAALVWTAANALLAIATALALLVAVRRRAWRLVLGCGFPIVLLTLATGSVGLERFRVPLMLPISIVVGSLIPANRRAASQDDRMRVPFVTR